MTKRALIMLDQNNTPIDRRILTDDITPQKRHWLEQDMLKLCEEGLPVRFVVEGDDG